MPSKFGSYLIFIPRITTHKNFALEFQSEFGINIGSDYAMNRIIRNISPRIFSALYFCIFTGCSNDDSAFEITEIRTESRPSSNIKVDASSVERFGSPATPTNAESKENTSLPLDWDVPKGWMQLEATAMRFINLKVAGHPNAECYLSIIPGRAGGVAENINRWRNQMSLPSLSVKEISRLPKKKLLNNDAVYIDLEGTFVGMSEEINKEGYKLAGMILEHPSFSIFVKMVGPKEIVEQETKHFHKFCSSLRVKPINSDSQESAKTMKPEKSKTSKISWEAPQAWRQEPQRAMRLVSFRIAPNSETECYVTALEGNAGGLTQNINRWRRQMELPELNPTAISDLPDIEMLGQTAAKLIELKGNFTGMSGPTRSESMMLGVICSLPNRTLFVKMVGPESEVAHERKNFLTFCQSIKLP